MQTLLLDIRYALRSLRRTPGLAFIAVLTLALGIGANTAIFSLVNAVLLRPLPYANPDQLIQINESANGSDLRHVSGHEFAAWREQNRVLDDVMAYEGADFNLTSGGDPRSVFAFSVSANYFKVLGVRAQIGRTFTNGDDRAGFNHVAVLSDALWRSRYSADSEIVGSSIRLNNESFTVIGVMGPRSFDPQLWVPMNLAGVVQKVGKHSLSVVGRLKADITLAKAREDLNRVSQVLAQTMPDQNAGHAAAPSSLYESLIGDSRRPVLIALGAVGFVLLIACANVAHLLLTRAANRQREIALRTALGASRARLITHLLTESLLVSVAGGLGGLLIATWIVELVPKLTSTHLARLEETGIDARVLGATALFILIAAIVSGLAPAIRSTLPRLGELLNEGVRSTVGRSRNITGFLVVCEVALALVLLVGAGLSTRSLVNLSSVQPGFDTRHLLLVGVALPSSRYPGPEQQRQMFQQLNSSIASLPNVVSVGTTTQLPLSGEDDWIHVGIEGRPSQIGNDESSAAWRVVNTDFFKTMRIPLVDGRTFQATDARISVPVIRWFPQQPYPDHFDEPQAVPVAVINETMARQFWPNENALGKRFKVLESSYFTVVGIVGDVKHRALGLRASPEMYLSDLQEPENWGTIAIRTSGEPLALAASVRARVRAIDRDLPLERIRTMDDVRDQSFGDARLNAGLLAAFGGLALIMAVIGIYGVISYAVAQRTHEIGIRTAIGASGRDVVELILGGALTLTTVGIVVGTVAALALTRVLENLLFGVKASDPATLISMVALLSSIVMLASYVPARRALHVDPVEALRAQ